MALGLLAALAVLLTASASFADDWRDNGRSSYDRVLDRYYDRENNHTERYEYQSAYRDHHRHDYGRPAPKLYKIGRPLPSYVAYRPVPRSVLRHLRPAPRGAFYAEVGGDILILADRSRRVIGVINF